MEKLFKIVLEVDTENAKMEVTELKVEKQGEKRINFGKSVYPSFISVDRIDSIKTIRDYKNVVTLEIYSLPEYVEKMKEALQNEMRDILEKKKLFADKMLNNFEGMPKEKAEKKKSIKKK
jgi:hypothetical protein